jgi:aminoglycoside phosphotransferase (APT) family kinase protein
MRRLRAAGYPVPEVRFFQPEPRFRGRPFVVMERIYGVPLGATYWSTPDPKLRQLQTVLYRLIARLHALDASAILPESPLVGTRDPYAAFDQEIANLTSLLGRLQGSEPRSLRDVLVWLADRRSSVPCEGVVVIHGDFHPGNVLLAVDEAPIVIDWSNVRLADYRSELAWTRLVTGAGASPGRAEAELRVYEEVTGKPVPDIELFDVAASTHLLLSVLISLRFGAARQGMRPEAEARMRQGAGFARSVAERLQGLTGTKMPDLDDELSALLA